MEEQSAPLDPQIELAPTSWPKVIGILSIVWGGLGLTCIACGIGGILLGPALMPAEMRDGPLPPNMRVAPWQAGMFAVGFALSVMLIVAGVQTLRRNMAGRTLHLAWAALSILLTIVNIYFGWRQVIEVEQWIRDNPTSPFAKGPQMSRSASMTLVIGLNCIGIIWPAFLLIWFGAVKRTKASFGAPPNADYI
jgi:hypothetical protein